MKKLYLLFAMALMVITLQSTFPSTASADTISIQTLLSPMLLAEVQTDNTTTEQPVEHRTTWGALKAIYRGTTPVPYSAERAESTATTASLRRGTIQPYSIGSSRYRVRNECWYALDRNWLNMGDDPNGPGGDGTMSNWNWLSKNADANGNGLINVLTNYQGCVSDLIPCNCCRIASFASPQNTISYWVNAMSNDNYGWGLRFGRYPYKGHGGECPSFVSMVIYRATGGQSFKWQWGSMGESSCPSAKYAQPCDIVFYYFRDASGVLHQHVGICVRNDGTKITVVDSNYVGGDGQEVIARHDVTYSQIGSTWKLYSGAGKWYN